MLTAVALIPVSALIACIGWSLWLHALGIVLVLGIH